jgi:hypothetical protein
MSTYRPGLLSLSIDILDTINAPVNSLEKAIQEKRIAHMLETRYTFIRPHLVFIALIC